MKITLVISLLIVTSNLFGKEIYSNEDTYTSQLNNDYKEVAHLTENKLVNLERTFNIMQREYEAKINFLQIELSKHKNKLIEKNLNEEKIQNALRNNYENEIANLRQELINKNRTVFELQRMVEKIKPTEESKELLKLNNQLASDLRRTEGQLAAYQNEKNISGEKSRMPASVKSK